MSAEIYTLSVDEIMILWKSRSERMAAEKSVVAAPVGLRQPTSIRHLVIDARVTSTDGGIFVDGVECMSL